jgi:hypothetical protein
MLKTAMGKVRVFRPARITENRKLFQEKMKLKMDVATIPGFDQGDGNPQEGPVVGAAVDEGGIPEFRRDVLEEPDHDPDDDGQADDEMGEDEGLVGIHHSQVAEQDVPGDEVADARDDAGRQDDEGQERGTGMGDAHEFIKFSMLTVGRSEKMALHVLLHPLPERAQSFLKRPQILLPGVVPRVRSRNSVPSKGRLVALEQVAGARSDDVWTRFQAGVSRRPLRQVDYKREDRLPVPPRGRTSSYA